MCTGSPSAATPIKTTCTAGPRRPLPAQPDPVPGQRRQHGLQATAVEFRVAGRLRATRPGDDSVFTASASSPETATWEAADRDGSDRTSTSSATGVAWSRWTVNNVTPPSSDATATASSTGTSPNAPVSQAGDRSGNCSTMPRPYRGSESERVVTGLPSRAATGLGHDRGAHVDQLGQAADAHHLTPRTAPHSISQLPQGILRRNPRDDLNNPPLQPFKATRRSQLAGGFGRRSAERDTPRRLSVRCRPTAPDRIPRRRTYRRVVACSAPIAECQ
jgi:hypothetical protein